MPNKPKTKSRAKTAKRFVLRVVVDSNLAFTRTQVRDAVQALLDGPIQVYEAGPFLKSARVTNADIN